MASCTLAERRFAQANATTSAAEQQGRRRAGAVSAALAVAFAAVPDLRGRLNTVAFTMLAFAAVSGFWTAREQQ